MMTFRFAVMFGAALIGIGLWIVVLITVGSLLKLLVRTVTYWQIRRQLRIDERRTRLTAVTWPGKAQR